MAILVEKILESFKIRKLDLTVHLEQCLITVTACLNLWKLRKNGELQYYVLMFDPNKEA
jgi:hypothetical protein